MKGCRALQIIFGIICALMTIALGTITVLMFAPYLGEALPSGVFGRMYDGVGIITSTVGLAGLEWVVLCVVFLLPTVLLVLATNLLLYGKRGGSIVAGSILGLLALVIVGGVTGWFSKDLFAHWQKLYLIILGGGSAFFIFMFVLTTSAVKRAKQKATIAPQEGNDEIVITVEGDGAVEEDNGDPSGDEGVIYMAQDYGSVSEVADETYEPNEVLPKKVLEKLKIARELYERGAITKDEYLSIVNKYLVQE